MVSGLVGRPRDVMLTSLSSWNQCARTGTDEATCRKIGEGRRRPSCWRREGWTVLHRNWSLRLGELDIVVRPRGAVSPSWR